MVKVERSIIISWPFQTPDLQTLEGWPFQTLSSWGCVYIYTWHYLTWAASNCTKSQKGANTTRSPRPCLRTCSSICLQASFRIAEYRWKFQWWKWKNPNPFEMQLCFQHVRSVRYFALSVISRLVACAFNISSWRICFTCSCSFIMASARCASDKIT